MPKSTAHKIVEPEAPARITDDHVQDRLLHKGDVNPSGWSRLSVFEKAHRKGKLVDRDLLVDPATRNKALEEGLCRYEAGKLFTELYLVSQPAFPSGSDYNRVRVVGVPGSFCDHQLSAKNQLIKFRNHMGRRDYRILELVLGEDHEIARAVLSVTTPAYKFSTLARFRESLDCLVEALEAVRRP